MDWSRSAISEKLHQEMCHHDDSLEPFSEQKKYYVDALQYANRRAIVKNLTDFRDVFHVYILTFSDELRDHIRRLDEDGLNEVINDAVKRIIKSRKSEVYWDYLQFEPLRWDLINGDGKGKGDGSLIAEHVNSLAKETAKPEDATPIQQLAKKIMKENIFKTTTDNEELYWYDSNGVYLPGQEWRIKYECQQIQPKIETHDVHEVINHIKRKTFIDRSAFDSNPDVINLQNGLLNIHTMALTPHSPHQHSITQLPVKYNPKARCPNFARFLNQVLKPKDVFTALELIGYCL
jgi:hypothetical protein